MIARVAPFPVIDGGRKRARRTVKMTSFVKLAAEYERIVGDVPLGVEFHRRVMRQGIAAELARRADREA